MTKHYPKDWIARASAHYCHACEKHPHFADVLFCDETLNSCEWNLKMCREILEKEEKVGNVYAEDLMLEEMWEVAEAVKDGDTAHAVEEIYDAVAVLMRMADMIERGEDNKRTTTIRGTVDKSGGREEDNKRTTTRKAEAAE